MSTNQIQPPYYKDIPALANVCYELGFEPIPVKGKSPILKGWTDAPLPYKHWHDNLSIGLRTGKVTGIDIDIYDKGIVDFILGCIDFQYLTRVGEPPKVLIPVICSEVTQKIISDRYVDSNGKVHGIELLSHGQQFVAYGIHPDTNRSYTWSDDLLTHTLPTVELDFILYLFDVFYELACKKGWKKKSQKVRQYEKSKKRVNGGDRIGDLYNEFYQIEDVLKEYGWKHYHGKYWTRPEKDRARGCSGKVTDNGNFKCYTTSTILEAEHSYSSFALMTYYEFNGDFSAAVKAVLQSMNEAA